MTNRLVDIFTPWELQQVAKNKAICKRCGEILVKNYPNRNWFVQIAEDGSLAYVFCADISMEYGISIHLTADALDVERKVKLAGGEILERFLLSRDKLVDDGETLLVDQRGEAIGAKQGEVVLAV